MTGLSSDRNPYRDGLERRLYQLGQKGLKPPQKYIHEGRELGQQVFLTLQKNCKEFAVARVHFAGSIGKKTDVVEPDLELVIIVDDRLPPFCPVLAEFEAILEGHQEELKIRENSIERKTSFSTHFVFENGIEVDLLPAANLSRDEIFKRLEANPEHYNMYNGSLVETQLEFMTSHTSSFLYIVVRLSKFWYQSLSFGDKGLSGASTIMELLGIAAAEKEEGRPGKPSVMRAFADVLAMVKRLTSKKLAFASQSNGKWAQVPEHELAIWNAADLVPQVVGSTDILRREYFIVDPANPFNNLLGDDDKLDMLERLMEYARVTQDRLRNLLAGEGEEVDSLDMTKLFEPQPDSLLEDFPSGLPDDIQLRYEYEAYSCTNCDFTVREGEPMERKEVWVAVDKLKSNLLTVLNATVEGSGGQATLEDVKGAIGTLISRNLAVSLDDTYEDRGENMDVTLTLPFEVEGERYALKLSMSWTGGQRRAFQVVDNTFGSFLSQCVLS